MLAFARCRARRTALVLVCIGAAIFSAAASADAGPPPAPSHPVAEVLHGVRVADPYRNLENVKSAETLGWLRAQGAYAAAQLARIADREAISARIEALAAASGDSVREVTRMPGGRIYYLKRKAGENQLKLVMRTGLDGAERVLVDPEAMAGTTGVPHAIDYFVPSWDGRWLAYGISAGGSEDASLHLMDIASGKDVGEPIQRVHEGPVHWTPDSRRVAYNQMRALPPGSADTETYLDTTVFLAEPGRAASTARPLFGPLVDKALALDRLDVAQVIFEPGSRYMIARTTDTTVPEGRVYVALVADLDRKPIPWRRVSSASDKITDVQMRGDTLYLRTYAGAPRGRVLALGLDDPVLAKATVAIPEPETGVLDRFTVIDGALLAEVRRGFSTRVRRYAMGGPAQGVDVAPGLSGSTFMTGDPAHAHRDVLVTTSAWTVPPRVMIAAADGTARDTGIRRTSLPPGSPELEVTEVLVPSHDGAGVPLAIVRRKGLRLDAGNPTLLYGYGAYGFSEEAHFDPRSIAWLERGGVLAFANVRGGGAFGDAWYRAGFKATKSNTWKDGVACARYLIAQRFASPRTLAVYGGSAGGIFVGRAVTSAPELFAAAIFDVGVMDAVRAEESANGITNISEFGSARNPAEFPALLEMSTYHQIRDGTPYPAVLLIHGLNDPRVDVWHSAKAAARLQAATSSGKPVLLRLDEQDGHGVGSTARQGYSKLADIYSFLLWQFAKAASKP
jgi:prolyl oligopeptidase